MSQRNLPIRLSRMEFGNSPLVPIMSGVEIAKIAGPIFGGTTPTPTTETPTTETESTTTTTESSGGSTTDTSTDDPVAKLQSDPNALSSLLKQMESLQKNFEKVTGERDQFVKQQEETKRAQLTKEQQLQGDLENAQATIEQMDRVIRQTALMNAFLSQGDFQWNSVRQALAELDDNNFDIDVDLEGGQATVTGMENEVKRIAQQCPWLVKSGGKEESNNGSRQSSPRRGSGNPPSPPKGNEQKQARRAELMKKFPVLAQGR